MLAAAVKQIKVGPWNAQPQPFMGSMISETAAKGMVCGADESAELGRRVVSQVTHLEAGTGLVSQALSM